MARAEKTRAESAEKKRKKGIRKKTSFSLFALRAKILSPGLRAQNFLRNRILS